MTKKLARRSGRKLNEIVELSTTSAGQFAWKVSRCGTGSSAWKNQAHYTELLYDRLQLIDGVCATETFFVIEAHKLAYGWGAGPAPLLANGHSGSQQPAGQRSP